MQKLSPAMEAAMRKLTREGWWSFDSADVHPQTLHALMRRGLVEHKVMAGWGRIWRLTERGEQWLAS